MIKGVIFVKFLLLSLFRYFNCLFEEWNYQPLLLHYLSQTLQALRWNNQASNRQCLDWKLKVIVGSLIYPFEFLRASYHNSRKFPKKYQDSPLDDIWLSHSDKDLQKMICSASLEYFQTLVDLSILGLFEKLMVNRYAELRN